MKHEIMMVTGHRPNKLGGYGESVREHLLDFAILQLTKYAPEQVITGMALGWDQAIAEAAVRLHIPFHAYVPFPGQENKWPQDSRDHYRLLLSQADNIIVCSEAYNVEAMQHRNECMVENASSCLALWDGTAGGTGNCVRYWRQVHEQGKGFNVYGSWLKFRDLCNINQSTH